MPTNVNQLFNSFIPTIQIGRVVLENGDKVVKNKTDPHIDYYYDFDGNIRTTLRYRAGLNIIPFSARSIEGGKVRDASEGTKITCTMVTKDVVTQNILGYWFKNRDVKKLLQVRFAYTTNPSDTERILRDNRGLDDEGYFAALELLTPKTLDEIVNIDGQQRVENGFDTHTTETDLDGNVVHTFRFDWIIEDLPDTTPYLAIFACCRLDIDALLGDAPDTLKINQAVIDAIPDEMLVGNLAYNVILEGDKVVSTMPIFTDEETGAIWTGPVHNLTQDGITRWKTGYGETQADRLESRTLTRRMVPNSRVQDFRVSSYLDKRVLEIQTSEKEIMGSLIKNSRNDLLDIERPRTYFSDIHFARDEVGNARFFFSMDYHRIIEENTRFGSLLKKKIYGLGISEIADACEIASLKIFRKRIAGSPEAGSPPFNVITSINADHGIAFDPISNPKNFNDNEVEELIIVTSQGGSNTISPVNYSKVIQEAQPSVSIAQLGESIANLSVGLTGPPTVTGPPSEPETIIGSFKELSSFVLPGTGGLQVSSQAILSGNGIKYFSGVDRTMGSVTDGYYQYRIELQIIDKTEQFITDRLRDLVRVQSQLRDYLYFITTPSQVGRNEPPPLLLSKTAAWHESNTAAIRDYLKVLFIFTNERAVNWSSNVARPANVQALYDQLVSWCNPELPNGVSKIIDLVNVLISKLSDVVEFSPAQMFQEQQKYNPLPNPPQSLVDASAPKISFKIENTFSSYFNSNIDVSTSFDFMGLDSDTSGMGIKTMTGVQFLQRIREETQRLFASESENVSFEINGEIANPQDSTQQTAASYVGPYMVRQSSGDNIDFSQRSPGVQNSIESFLVYNFTQAGAIPPSITAYNTTPPQLSPASQAIVDGVSIGSSTALSTAFESFSLKLAELGITTDRGEALPEEFFGIVDSVEKDNTTCTLNPNSNLAINPASLFNYVMSTIGEDAYEKGNKFASTGQAMQNERDKRNQLDATARNIRDAFNPDRLGGPVSQYMSVVHSRPAPVGFRSAPTFAQDWTLTMPNALKALTKEMSATSPVMSVNDLTMITQATGSIAQAQNVTLKFLTINVIEVLMGYKNKHDQSKRGRNKTANEWIELKEPVWERMTAEIYNNNSGNTILCRVKPYENITFGIVRNSKTEPPTIDEYFFLVPSGDFEISLYSGAGLPTSAQSFSPSTGNAQNDLAGISTLNSGLRIPLQAYSLSSFAANPEGPSENPDAPREEAEEESSGGIFSI